MTITVTCQYTGIEFEAASKRSKNHPQVAKFLDEASKEIKMRPQAYSQAKEILAQARNNFDNIDELMAAVNAAYTDWRNGTPSKHVLTYKEIRAIGRAEIRRMERMSGGEWDELNNDGIGDGSRPPRDF